MKLFTKLTVFLYIALFLAITVGQSQEVIDSEGKDFRFAFMPNYHSWRTDGSDSLYVFVFSKTPTKGTLFSTDKFGNTDTWNFTIDKPNGSAKFQFYYANYELLGQNNGGELLFNGGGDEQIRNTSFHLISDDDVTVIIHNEAHYTSDACLVFPTTSLGKNYYVLSYETNALNSGDQATPSQFVIVATEDSTNITIKPTTPTFRNGMSWQNITLNKGQVYLVQADIVNPSPSTTNYDLTGTSVVADKNIVVLGGHQRANVPYFQYASRDYMIEQMLPLEAWGREVFITPVYQPNNNNPNYDDVAKVTVAFDNTELYINGQLWGTLDAGERYTVDVTEPMYITGNKPICAAFYKKSSNSPTTSDGTISIGDPFMLVLPPKTQFLNEYNFMNLDLPGKYISHWINIVIPTASIPSIRLDGLPITTNFIPIADSEYSYTNYQVIPGVHHIKADVNFGLTIYGYGQTNSYGYIGGLRIEPLDWNPPHYNLNSIDCFSAGFTLTEKNELDRYIASVSILEQRNIDYKVLDSSRAEYSAELQLIDRYNDGIFRFAAVDSIGYTTQDTIVLEGFTLTLSKGNMYQKVDYSDTVGINTSTCFDVTIYNYGLVRKDISNLKLRNGTIINKSSTPKYLDAGDSASFQVCYQADFTPGWYSDTLDMYDSCYSEVMGTFAFYLMPDENKPDVEAESIGCSEGLLKATEHYLTDYGFGTYELVQSDNVEIVLQSLTVKEIILKMKLQDPYKDGTYEITFKDRAGNDTTVNGVLQGFTASFVENSDGTPITFSTQSIGNSKCIDILIENNGLLPITLDDISFAEKLNFFVPQSQLPITIQPDSVAKFTICFNGNIPSAVILKDELSMTFNNCLTKKITVEGKPERILVNADTKCDYNLIITLDKVGNSLSLEKIFPNPATEELNLQLNVDKTRKMSIDLVGVNGHTFEVLDDNLERGNYNIRIDTRNVPSGAYILQINSEDKRISKKVLISK